MTETNVDSSDKAESLIEVMRKELRHTAVEDRKFHRSAALNEKRLTLDESEGKKFSWKSSDVAIKAKELKKRALSMDDYLMLQTSLIQDEANIDSFLKVDNVLTALTRDLSSRNPAIQLVAANCCCNIALANSRACISLAKTAGPYLVAELDTLNYHLVEICAWTIGNLSIGSKIAFELLYAQGCLKRLISLLIDSDSSIIPSLIYAIKRCLYAGSDIITDSETTDLARAVINRCRCLNDTETLWLLALLSSREACTEILCPILPIIFHHTRDTLETEASNVEQVTPAIRIFANTVCESNGKAADAILDYPDEKLAIFFEKLLGYTHSHVRKETLWLIGNLYSHDLLRIRQRVRDFIHLLPSLKLATS